MNITAVVQIILVKMQRIITLFCFRWDQVAACIFPAGYPQSETKCDDVQRSRASGMSWADMLDCVQIGADLLGLLCQNSTAIYAKNWCAPHLLCVSDTCVSLDKQSLRRKISLVNVQVCTVHTCQIYPYLHAHIFTYSERNSPKFSVIQMPVNIRITETSVLIRRRGW